MDLEGIRLSEISQTEDKYLMILFICGKTKTKVKLFGNINRDLEHLKLLIL